MLWDFESILEFNCATSFFWLALLPFQGLLNSFSRALSSACRWGERAMVLRRVGHLAAACGRVGRRGGEGVLAVLVWGCGGVGGAYQAGGAGGVLPGPSVQPPPPPLLPPPPSVLLRSPKRAELSLAGARRGGSGR